MGTLPDDEAAYAELQAYTLTRHDREFLHQHVVDARVAQQASGATKPMALTFALMGLCLHVDHGWTGRQVQLGHMRLAALRPTWPALHLSDERGHLGPADVMARPAGHERDAAIREWARVVWTGYADRNRDALCIWLLVHGLRPDRPLHVAESGVP